MLPLLDSFKETAQYASWVKARLEYLELADELNIVVPPPEGNREKPQKPVPNPGPQKEREIWISKITQRPWPPNAKQLIPKLKPVFSEEQVPPELVWIAEVESAFDANAQSPAGAAGLFQLMPATAKQYGLRRWPLDQRYRPEESARAAAKYLRYLHGRFKDWRLVLAAYNAGQGTVQNLLDRHKVQGFDAISQFLPAETQMYVPRVEASILRREGVSLAELKSPKAQF
jgi:membrane-bound lytic murein transglycosylase D